VQQLDAQFEVLGDNHVGHLRLDGVELTLDLPEPRTEIPATSRRTKRTHISAHEDAEKRGDEED
jgi:hypothetical protein